MVAWQALVAGTASSLFFVVLNVAMNIYTKWLFAPSGGAFALPWTMLAVQQAQAYAVLQPWLARLDPVHWGWGWQTSSSDSIPQEDMLSMATFWQVLAVTVLFCLNVGFNSLSLVEISITLNQTVRAFLPAGVLLLAKCIEQRDYHPHSYWTTIVLVGGIALACWGSPDFRPYGFGLALLSTCVAALGTSLNGRLLSSGPFSKSSRSASFGIARLIMLQSLPAFCMFSFVAWWTERDALRAILSEGGRWTWCQRVLLVSLSSCLALLSNLGRCFLVAATSALMETMAGNAKVAALCVIDHHFFGTRLFLYNYAGIALTFLGFSIHVLLQYASPPPKDDGAGKADWSEGGHGCRAAADGGRPRPSRLGERPRLISAADTGLAAEHVAVQIGRRRDTGSGDALALAEHGLPAEGARPRSVTWPAGRPSEAWTHLELSRVLEVPSWLDPPRHVHYRPLTSAGAGGAAAADASGSRRGASSGAAGAAAPSGGGSPTRSRAHTDPTFWTSRPRTQERQPEALAPVAEDEEGGPLPPPVLQPL